ncbi:hypothetical protein PIB30_103834 [Stylosanthes scabra]|uniref:Uncharacterized protein n=1 Tax=Stylosanthes scabra TaxID=79078 RepID=A0ABU6WZR9_9FABA|nr:hypothetical protein [Stylosanthes scabra]
MEKQSRFDHLRTRMAEVEGTGPRSILPTPTAPAASAGASASSPTTVVPPGPSASATKSKKKPPVTSTEKPICLDGEEGVKEDPSADLRQKKRKRKAHESFPEDAVLGDDVAWGHKVNPLDRAFPEGFNLWAALDFGITQSFVREALGPVLPEQLLGTAQRYACKLTACLQIGIENALSSKFKMKKDLATAKDQVAVLTVEQDTALTSPPLKVEVDSLTQQLSLAEGKRLSAVARMSEMEESCKTTLGKDEAAADRWCQEWKALAAKTEEIVQENFEILMDQVCHLNSVVDFSVITLDTRWDPKGQRIYNPKAEAKECPEPPAKQPESQLEVQLERTVPEERASEEGGEYPVGYVPSSRNLGAFYGGEPVGAFSEDFNYPVRAFPVCS